MPDDPPLAATTSRPVSKPAWPRWRARLMHVWASSLDVLTPQRVPGRLSIIPLDSWPGDPAAGERLVRDWSAGTILWEKDVISSAGPNRELTGSADLTPSHFMHEFTWLRDLRALGGDEARACARELTGDWLTRYSRWSAKAGDPWRADILAARQVAWLSQFELFYANAPDSLRRDVLAVLARQHRHLRWTAAREVDGLPRLAALKGLLYGNLCVSGFGSGSGSGSGLTRTLRLLENELAVQISPDGGCRDRNPTSQVALVRHLVDIRATLTASGQEAPPGAHTDILKTLNAALRHATPLVQMLRHGDGKLAHFNGGAESDPGLIDLALAQANIRVRTPKRAPDSGYERLSAGKCLVLVDTGAPAVQGGHAGATSFELSFGRERLVVNCGAAKTADPAWRRAGRATAAHSTLSVADTNSSETLGAGSETLGAGSETPAENSDGGARIATVTCERNDADSGAEGGSWLTISHDGYAARFGLTHRRRLYLSASGADLRGEDALIHNDETQIQEAQPDAPFAAPPFAIRFHLHPTVAASLSRDGEAVLLQMPSGVGWQFRAAGAALELADSIYLTDAAPKRTRQIVLSAKTDATGDTVVKWSLRREGAR